MFNSNIVIKLHDLCRWILVITVGLGWLGGSTKKSNRIRSFWSMAVRFKAGSCFHAFLTWSDMRTRYRQLSLFYLVLLSWLINSVDKPVNHSYSPQMWMSLQMQGHPTDLFLTISVLQRKFCWLGTEVSAVLLGSKVLNLRSRIYQMYQKFLPEVFYPSNLLEIFFVRELCGVAR